MSDAAAPPAPAAPPAKQPAPKPDPNAGLVAMVKDGTKLFVHPTTVAAHRNAGWTLA